MDVQTDFIEIDFDVEHRSGEVLFARVHDQDDACFDVQRAENYERALQRSTEEIE